MLLSCLKKPHQTIEEFVSKTSTSFNSLMWTLNFLATGHLHTCQVLRFVRKDYGFHNRRLLFSFLEVLLHLCRYLSRSSNQVQTQGKLHTSLRSTSQVQCNTRMRTIFIVHKCTFSINIMEENIKGHIFNYAPPRFLGVNILGGYIQITS